MDYSIDTTEPIWPAGPSVAAPVGRQFTDIECARLIGRFLALTAHKLNVVWAPGTQPVDLCRNLVLAAQGGGKLDPGAYRLLWELWGASR